MRLHYPSPTHVKTKYIKLIRNKCKACWTCIEACPNNVMGSIDIRFHKHAHIDKAKLCEGCKKCIKACPQSAIIDRGVKNIPQ